MSFDYEWIWKFTWSVNEIFTFAAIVTRPARLILASVRLVLYPFLPWFWHAVSINCWNSCAVAQLRRSFSVTNENQTCRLLIDIEMIGTDMVVGMENHIKLEKNHLKKTFLAVLTAANRGEWLPATLLIVHQVAVATSANVTSSDYFGWAGSVVQPCVHVRAYGNRIIVSVSFVLVNFLISSSSACLIFSLDFDSPIWWFVLNEWLF